MKVLCICVLTLVLSTCIVKGRELKQNDSNYTELEDVGNDLLNSLLSIGEYGLYFLVKIDEEIQTNFNTNIDIYEFLLNVYEDYTPKDIKKTNGKVLNDLFVALSKSEKKARKLSKDIANETFNSLPVDTQEKILNMGRAITYYLNYFQDEVLNKLVESMESEESSKNKYSFDSEY